MIAAEQAVREWVNSKTATLTGKGHPLSQGAYLRELRSPADGPYAVVRRAGGAGDVTAESDGLLSTAVIQFSVYSAAEDVAEDAATALFDHVELLTGCPEPCGDTGVSVLVADKTTGPVLVPDLPNSGEPFCFQVTTEFTLRKD